jgi:uncharacterized OsmC-like protein
MPFPDFRRSRQKVEGVLISMSQKRKEKKKKKKKKNIEIKCPGLDQGYG